MGRLSGLVPLLALVVLLGCGGAPRSSPAPTDGPTRTATTGPSGGPSGDPSGGPTSPPGSLDPNAVFVPLPDFPAAGAFEVTGVTATDDGFLAVGFGAQGGEDYFGRRQGIVWRSTDGVSWEETVAPELAGVSPLLVASIGSVDYMAGLLSVCAQFSEEECADVPEAGNAIWRSEDGGAWEMLPQQPGMQGAIALDALVVLGEALVISGSAGDEGATATVWTSTDGVEWTESTDLAGLDPISALAAGGPGLVALGTHFSADQENVTVNAATSADGVTFAPATVPTLTNSSIDGAAAGSSGFVGVGYGECEDMRLCATTVYSADGLSWVQGSASDGSLAASALIDAHALPDGYVALGFTPHDDDIGTQDGQSWITPDGRNWHALAPVGDSFSVLTASAVGAAGLIVFTVDQEEDEVSITSTVSAFFAPMSALVP